MPNGDSWDFAAILGDLISRRLKPEADVRSCAWATASNGERWSIGNRLIAGIAFGHAGDHSLRLRRPDLINSSCAPLAYRNGSPNQ